MNPTPQPVLVVGGSLVGLSAAVFLRAHDVPTVLVEPHLGSSPHPRAVGYPPRTMELFREVGLSDAIPQVPPTITAPRRARVESLAGESFEESPWTPVKVTDGPPAKSMFDYTPCTAAALVQDGIEHVLREKAISSGADLRLGTRLVRFEQDTDGVTAWLRAGDADEYPLRTPYLIAADGNRSPVREALGVARTGRGALQTQRSVLFRASLDQYLESGMVQFEIDQPDFKAFLTTYRDQRWVLMFPDDIERDQATLLAAVHRVIGRDDVDVEIIATGRWELNGLIADDFSVGRVFLTGDAAHTLPPTRGGYGANTGIHDVHNLAWKISAVLAGSSTPALLDTYGAERRPVAWQRLEQTFARPDYRAVADGFADGVSIIDPVPMELGQLYRSTSVLGAGDDLPVAARPDEWAGQPGTRAPHLWIDRRGERISTLDLFGRGWVLLADDNRWDAAAQTASTRTGTEIHVVSLGRDLNTADGAAVREAFGLPAGGASLVRPDGVVAWRCTQIPPDPDAALTDALARTASSPTLTPDDTPRLTTDAVQEG